MQIRNILHRALQRFVEKEDARGLPPAAVGKLTSIIVFLDSMKSEEEMLTLKPWKPHRLSGSRKDTWSLSVSGNWRITFKIDAHANEIYDLNFEDYH